MSPFPPLPFLRLRFLPSPFLPLRFLPSPFLRLRFPASCRRRSCRFRRRRRTLRWQSQARCRGQSFPLDRRDAPSVSASVIRSCRSLHCAKTALRSSLSFSFYYKGKSVEVQEEAAVSFPVTSFVCIRSPFADFINAISRFSDTDPDDFSEEHGCHSADEQDSSL